MTDDECQLLLRSYADQAARNVEPPPVVEVILIEETTENIPAEFEIVFHHNPAEPLTRSAAVGARDRCRNLLDADPSVVSIEPFETEHVIGLAVWNMTREAHEKWMNSPAPRMRGKAVFRPPEPPPRPLPEDHELAPALDPLQGPIDLTLPGMPPLEPHRPTRAMAIGLSLQPNGWVGQIYWQADFPDADRAEYWALKRAREHKSKGFRAATSLRWQHDATPDELLQKALTQLNPPGRGPVL